MLEGVDGGNGVGGVIGADGNGVQLLVVDHFLVAGIEVNALNAKALHEGFGLAGDQIGGGDDFDVGHILVALDMSLGDPAGADDAHLQLAGRVNLFLFFGLSKLAQNRISVFAHVDIPPQYCVVRIQFSLQNRL